MCLECRILGALAHHNKMGSKQLVAKFSSFDFRPLPSEVKDYLVDSQSEAYLKDTLEFFKTKCDIDLKVIKVDSDGSCLPYAVSRCLIGKEILYDALREALHAELTEHEDFYAKTFRQGMDETTWKVHWTNILEEARPTRGMRTARWLGPGEHLVAMANVLARPILLLDKYEILKRSDGVTCGMYLPSRLTRQEVLDRNGGAIASPIVIAWANEKRNHFVALIRTLLPLEDQRKVFLDEAKFLTKDAAISIERSCFKADKQLLNERNQLRKMEMPIQVPMSGPNEFVQLKDSETGEDIKIPVPSSAKPGSTFNASFLRPAGFLERCWMKLLLENSSTPRVRAINTLKLVIENLVDAYLSGDFAKVSKVSKLKLDNQLVKNNLLTATGAIEFLYAVGFVRCQGEEAIEFKNFDEKLVNARDALRVLALEVSSLKDIEGEIKAGLENILFGDKPACSIGIDWGTARETYAFDGIDAGKNANQVRRDSGVWILSANGTMKELERKRLVDILMAGLRKDFESVSTNSEVERVDWDDVLLYNKRLMHVKCSDCSQDQEWTGPVDGYNAELHSQACSKCAKPLKAEWTGARKLLNFVGQASKEGDWRAVRCEKCSSLVIGRDVCPFCVSTAQ